MIREYIQCAVLAMSTVKIAEVLNWLPAPETAVQAAILALLSGLMGGAGRWIFEKLKKIKI